MQPSPGAVKAAVVEDDEVARSNNGGAYLEQVEHIHRNPAKRWDSTLYL